MKLKHATSSVALGLLAGGAMSVNAGEVPPQGGLPLSAILQSIEGQHLGAIAEAEFDDGLWEIKACQATGCDKLYIDPVTGKQARRRMSGPEPLPAAGSLALSSVVQGVEANQHGRISEIEFEHGQWEVELRNGIHKTKLLIDPMTGKPVH